MLIEGHEVGCVCEPCATHRRTTTGADELSSIIAFDAKNSRFNQRHPRVSSVSHCIKKTVAIHLGRIPNEVSFFYTEAGYALQERALMRFKKRYSHAEQEVSVPTGMVFGGEIMYTHPDIYIPELKRGIQVKSTKIEKFSKDNMLSDFHHDQSLLEWHCWAQAKYCITESGERLEGVPKYYEVMYICRTDYGQTSRSFPITYDAARARELHRRYMRMQTYVESGELPEREMAKPNFECGYSNEFGDNICPMFFDCWGKEYVSWKKRR